MKHDLIFIIDCGAQYMQLIARRVREHRIYCEIVSHDVTAAELAARKPVGIIISGGPASVYDEGAPRLDPEIYNLGIPILGICYGLQVMTLQLGGEVTRARLREYGRTEVSVRDGGQLFAGLDDRLETWMSHGDHVVSPGPGFSVVATSSGAPVAAIADDRRQRYGVQFHPEVNHTPRGRDILANFLFRICRARPTWTMTSFIEQAVSDIREQVGDGRVVCGLSGGVDSSVCAALLYRAIGDRLTCVFVDHGLLRKDEARTVVETFGSLPGLNLVHIDASDRFLRQLEGITDPEEKRKLVGVEFIRVFEEQSKRIGQVEFLAQGTLYPDVIESGTQSAALIKTHHNVGGLPDDMDLKLIEPLRDLFKDEVRELGEELGLSPEIVWRQPFPGPGLAIRIVGEVTRERLDILREADAIVREEIGRAALDREVWQYFAVLVAVRTVGVMGDQRSYAYPIVVRAVTSSDGMTADWARLPSDLLAVISSRIINEVPHVNRVALDITSKPPGTIEWE